MELQEIALRDRQGAEIRAWLRRNLPRYLKLVPYARRGQLTLGLRRAALEAMKRVLSTTVATEERSPIADHG